MNARHPLHPLLLSALVLLAATMLACSRGSNSGGSEQTIVAQELGVQECAACGMVVREQPAPRAQLVHRNGQRAFFCSISELIHYAQVPSPHGSAVVQFVEVLSASDDLRHSSTDAHPWVHPEDATYLLGVPRAGVMGLPVLSYRTAQEAQQAAKAANAAPSGAVVPAGSVDAQAHPAGAAEQAATREPATREPATRELATQELAMKEQAAMKELATREQVKVPTLATVTDWKGVQQAILRGDR